MGVTSLRDMERWRDGGIEGGMSVALEDNNMALYWCFPLGVCLFVCVFVFEPRLMCGFVGVGTAHGSAAHCCPLQGEMGKAGAVWLWVGTDPLKAAL